MQCFLCVLLVSSRALFCTECSRVLFLVCCWLAHVCCSAPSAVELCTKYIRVPFLVGCWLAHACSYAPSAVELCSLRCTSKLTRALLRQVQSSAFLGVSLVSSRLLFCTECSRALFFALCRSAHAGSSVPSAVEFMSWWVAG